MADSGVISHIDDLGGSHSANVAMLELAAAGSVTSGSVMVPPGWFAEIVSEPAFFELDLGIHLTVTSESAAFRWGPLTDAGRAGGLVDDDGYLWSTVTEARANAHPEAVDTELRAQVDRALARGLDVTHLDHHMGVALAPEFVANTVQIAFDYRLPMLFPGNLAEYGELVNMGPADIEVLRDARSEALQLGVAVGDTFVMPLMHHDAADRPATLREALSELPYGITYLSLHCAAPGDIEATHPKDHAWRLTEYEVFRDGAEARRLMGPELLGMRPFRDALRSL